MLGSQGGGMVPHDDLRMRPLFHHHGPFDHNFVVVMMTATQGGKRKPSGQTAQGNTYASHSDFLSKVSTKTGI